VSGFHLREWRRESLRTTLWLIPSLLVVAAAVLFSITYSLDRAADNGVFTLPSWVNTGSADAARTILTTIAAAVITVVGVVFSITILALTLASTQFGPRMLRNFISDRGTQLTLGTFVGTFVFCVLALGSVAEDPSGPFVPHLSVTVALALLLVDLGVLIYFIHHVAKSIQLTEVVHRIAGDLDRAIDDLHARSRSGADAGRQPSTDELHALETDAAEVPAERSGYLQAFGYADLVQTATANEAVVRLEHRPGHFAVRGRPLAVVWPRSAAAAVALTLERSHVVGPHRTLQQDLQFAIDQLVEIALRALSPAVNDTFTALTCIDWLGDGLCKITSVGLPDGLHHDADGNVRVIEARLSYERVVNRAFDKVRQAGRGMPAINIRQLDSLAKIAEYTSTDDQRSVLARQAEMILRSAQEAVPEPEDQRDVRSAYDGVVGTLGGMRDALPRAREFLPPSRLAP
jgi:uncharacterized membrane protein